jgi:hypothetical protein
VQPLTGRATTDVFNEVFDLKPTRDSLANERGFSGYLAIYSVDTKCSKSHRFGMTLRESFQGADG